MEKYIKVQLYKITISKNGTFIREVNVIADSIEEALVIGREVAGEGYDIGAITKSYKPCFKAATKTITVEL